MIDKYSSTDSNNILRIKNFISEFETKDKIIKQIGAVFIDNSKIALITLIK